MDYDKPTQTDYAYKALKEDILEVKLAPDFPLKMSWLKENYNYGTTPLREALSRLQKDNLVVLKANKGNKVAPVSIVELMELYKTRKIIKEQLLRESMLYGDKSWEANIIATHYKLSKERSPLGIRDDYDEHYLWVQAHDEFDFALISAHRSPWMRRFDIQLTEHIRRQCRAFRILIPATEKEEFSAAMKKSQSLRALYAMERYDEFKTAALERKFNLLPRLVNKHMDLVLLAYNELYHSPS